MNITTHKKKGNKTMCKVCGSRTQLSRSRKRSFAKLSLWDTKENNDLREQTKLDCSHCTTLMDFMGYECLPNLESLDAYACFSLFHLPTSLPKLEVLALAYCESITTSLKDCYCPKLVFLNVWRSKNIRCLPDNLSMLEALECSDCSSLVSIPNNLPKLKHLFAQNCILLESLPSHCPLLEILQCNGSRLIKRLPTTPMPNLKNLTCHNCPMITELPKDGLKLEALSIFGCFLITELPTGLRFPLDDGPSVPPFLYFRPSLFLRRPYGYTSPWKRLAVINMYKRRFQQRSYLRKPETQQSLLCSNHFNSHLWFIVASYV